MSCWMKGLPLPEGCEDFSIAGIIYNPIIDKINLVFEDEIPEEIKQKTKDLPSNSIIE